jgi:hypothetical protein
MGDYFSARFMTGALTLTLQWSAVLRITLRHCIAPPHDASGSPAERLRRSRFMVRH